MTPVGDQKLQAKVYIEKGESLELCKLLVSRYICCWVPRDDAVKIGNQVVLNGLFAAGKGSFLESGGEVQRLIMNLKPSNAVLKQLHGSTGDLPSICQYLSVVLGNDEMLEMSQSDMSCAFYLFRLPPVWGKILAFNVGFDGEQLGLQKGVQFQLACCVIPMGSGPAVAIMQEIADRLTSIGRLPRTHQVCRTAPLPPWLVESLDQGLTEGRAWYHVYLDNLEHAWESEGVLSSAKKSISGALRGQELGAELASQTCSDDHVGVVYRGSLAGGCTLCHSAGLQWCFLMLFGSSLQEKVFR